ncbi:MAG: hypothetical protein IMF11_09080, partial [Proteobacteria bacterium]|nr:hypothetical protein [Pseudomonadota bacterium]
MNDIFPTWTEDNEFKALPGDRKKRILSNYFDKNISDDEFTTLDPKRQEKIRGRFVDKGLGIAEIEETHSTSAIEETRLIPAVGRAALTLPPTLLEMGAGFGEYLAEKPERRREEIVSSLGLIQREGAPLPKKKPVPEKPIAERVKGIGKFGIFMESLEEELGKQWKPVGKAVEYVRGTEPVKRLMEHKAKGRIAEAMIGKEMPKEAAKLVKEEKYKEAEDYLVKSKFIERPEIAEKYERDPLAKAIEVGGERYLTDSLAKVFAVTAKWARGKAADVRPETKRGTAAYYIA